MNPNLLKLNWKELIVVYKYYGSQLQELQRIKKSITLEWLNRGFNSLALDAWWFESAFNAEANELNERVKELDFEIARRNSLIGVIG